MEREGRRKGADRRQQVIEVAVERRKNIDRRSGYDRRLMQIGTEVDRRV